jgi:hypothetical protein
MEFTIPDNASMDELDELVGRGLDALADAHWGGGEETNQLGVEEVTVAASAPAATTPADVAVAVGGCHCYRCLYNRNHSHGCGCHYCLSVRDGSGAVVGDNSGAVVGDNSGALVHAAATPPPTALPGDAAWLRYQNSGYFQDYEDYFEDCTAAEEAVEYNRDQEEE